MKIITAGGGTGGHISPILAIIKEIQGSSPQANIVYVGSSGSVEEKLVPQTGIKMIAIRSGKFRRYHKSKILNLVDPTTILKNAMDFKNFILGIFDSLKIIKEEKPDIIFLKGGYVSLPLGIAARIKRRPYFIHESDVVPGLANRMLEKKAQKIFVSHPVSNFSDLPEEKLIYSGNPIRKDLLEGNKTLAYENLNLKKNLKTILVLGGSQGARRINEVFSEKLENYLEKYQVVHVSGDLDYDWLDHKSKDYKNRDRYRLYSFLTNDLKNAYAVSDIIISRAGNNVLTEIAAVKKPAVIVPLESSANDHQLANALVYSREGAVYVMLQRHLTGEKLFNQIESLLNNEEELKFMSEKIHHFYKEDAAKLIANHLINFYKKTMIDKEREGAKKKDRDEISPTEKKRK